VDGTVIQNPGIRGIDGSGNILFTGTKPDGTGFYVATWDGNGAHIVMTQGHKMADGRQISNVGSGRGCGDGFIVGVATGFLRYRNAKWDYLADPSQPLASGAPPNNLGSFTFDANRECDVVFTADPLTNGTLNLGARIGGSYLEIQDLEQLTSDGELIRVSQMLINDDATIYILGANDRGEEVLYRATPVRG
jgi:hypothetical protein